MYKAIGIFVNVKSLKTKQNGKFKRKIDGSAV